MKGAARGKELDITILGGTADDLTTLIVGGPELARGAEYVLFLSRQDLRGVARGIYFMRVHVGDVKEVRKLLLIK